MPPAPSLAVLDCRSTDEAVLDCRCTDEAGRGGRCALQRAQISPCASTDRPPAVRSSTPSELRPHSWQRGAPPAAGVGEASATANDRAGLAPPPPPASPAETP